MDLLMKRELGLCTKEAFMREMHFPPALVQRLTVERTLSGHQGCVNRLAWNQEGTRLASGSDDRKIMIWSVPGPAGPPLALTTQHRANIFGVQFLPCTGDTKLVSAAMDHTVQLHELSRADVSPFAPGAHGQGRRGGSGGGSPVSADQSASHVYYCHTNRVKDVKVEPLNPNNFWSAGEDGMVRQFDVRCRQHTTNDAPNVLLSVSSSGGAVELKALDINKCQPHLLGVSCGDPYVRVFDRRKLSLGRPPARGAASSQPLLQLAPMHLTCSAGGRYGRTHSTYLNFSHRGDQLVATYHGDNAYTFDLTGAMKSVIGLPPGRSPVPADPAPAPCRSSSSAGPSTSPRGPRPLPEAAEAARRQGNRAIFEEEWSTAIAALTQALDLAPWCGSLYARRAEALLARGWPGDALWALQDCEEAVSLDPKGCPLAYFRRVRALQALKQLQCARTALDEFTSLFPERSHTEEVAAVQAALERALRQRERQWEQWRVQRGREAKERKEAQRCIQEGRRTPRPQRSPTASLPRPGASPPQPVPPIAHPVQVVTVPPMAQALSSPSGSRTDGGTGVPDAPPQQRRTAWEEERTADPGASGGTSGGTAGDTSAAVVPAPNGTSTAPCGTGDAAPEALSAGGQLPGEGDTGQLQHLQAGGAGTAGGVAVGSVLPAGGTAGPTVVLPGEDDVHMSEGAGGGGSGGGGEGRPSGTAGDQGEGVREGSSVGEGPVGRAGRQYGLSSPSSTSTTPMEWPEAAQPGSAGEEEETDEDEELELGVDLDLDLEEAGDLEDPRREVLLPLYARPRGPGSTGGRGTAGGTEAAAGSSSATCTGGEGGRATVQATLRGSVLQRYIGHCNMQTDIKEAVFVGQGDGLIACGSDDGRVYVYCSESGVLLRALQADEDVANCVQPHPYCAMLATSGIENVIRLWSPGPEPSLQQREALQDLVTGNQARNREGPAVLRASHLRALADSPHLYSLLLSQLYGRGAGGDGGTGPEEEDDGGDPRAEVSCRVN